MQISFRLLILPHVLFSEYCKSHNARIEPMKGGKLNNPLRPIELYEPTWAYHENLQVALSASISS